MAKSSVPRVLLDSCAVIAWIKGEPEADLEWSCFASPAWISRKTGQGERTVRRLLEALETSGAVRRDRTSDRVILGEGVAR